MPYSNVPSSETHGGSACAHPRRQVDWSSAQVLTDPDSLQQVTLVPATTDGWATTHMVVSKKIRHEDVDKSGGQVRSVWHHREVIS